MLKEVIEHTERKLDYRLADDSDRGFLEVLYGTTRAAELAMVPWDDAQKAEFIAMQFNAQHTFYSEQFKDAEFGIIVKNDSDIGRLYLDQRATEIRIIDIALMPNYQKMGIGKALLLGVQSVAEGAGLPITIHVEKSNPAMALYKQLGYQMVEDQGVYDLLRWGG